MGAADDQARVVVIDIARFYAMAFVFYGHFIEEFMLLKNATAAGQYKFIYAFHMILFIVLAGYVAKERDFEGEFGRFIWNRFFKRLLPFFFFTLLMMVPPIFFEGKFMGLELPSMEGYAKGLISTVFGIPMFCVPSWFLLLIIGVELVHFGTFRFLKDSNAKIGFAILAFYVAGYWFNLKLDLFNPLKGRIVGWNYLFIHEAIILYSFYLVGIYLQRKRVFIDRVTTWKAVLGAVVMLLVVIFTYQLNTGPFNFNVYNAVVIMFSSHGHILLFPLTAIAGCAFILLLAGFTPAQRTIVWLGQNTLILMCLNGVFYHYINPPAAKWVLDEFSGSATAVTAAGVGVTIFSLLCCIPLIYGLNKYVPQLIGKPKSTGPFFNRFIA